MKKALVVIIGIILVVAALVVFFFEKPMVDISKYEYLKEPRITEMPNQKMIEIELTGNPNETASKAMGELFPVFYMLKSSGNTMSKPLPKARWSGDLNNVETMVGKYAMQVWT